LRFHEILEKSGRIFCTTSLVGKYSLWSLDVLISRLDYAFTSILNYSYLTH
jgi:hypothetical protein